MLSGETWQREGITRRGLGLMARGWRTGRKNWGWGKKIGDKSCEAAGGGVGSKVKTMLDEKLLFPFESIGNQLGDGLEAEHVDDHTKRSKSSKPLRFVSGAAPRC